MWYGVGLEIASSWVRIPPVAVVFRCQLTPESVNEYKRKLGSKQAYHAMN